MGRQAVEAQGAVSISTGSDQLARRVLAMVDSPVAWLGKRVRIHRLDTDGDAEWGEVMDRLAATNGLQMDFEETGSVILQWEGGPVRLRASGAEKALIQSHLHEDSDY